MPALVDVDGGPVLADHDKGPLVVADEATIANDPARLDAPPVDRDEALPGRVPDGDDARLGQAGPGDEEEGLFRRAGGCRGGIDGQEPSLTRRGGQELPAVVDTVIGVVANAIGEDQRRHAHWVLGAANEAIRELDEGSPHDAGDLRGRARGRRPDASGGRLRHPLVVARERAGRPDQPGQRRRDAGGNPTREHLPQ